jgi:hypothetical protein
MLSSPAFGEDEPGRDAADRRGGQSRRQKPTPCANEGHVRLGLTLPYTHSPGSHSDLARFVQGG